MGSLKKYWQNSKVTGVTFMIVKTEKFSYDVEDGPNFERKLVSKKFDNF
jgi:hypothetical protein